ncbi:peptidase [Caballeronia mineralivorans PML1(12)]|uniref:Peptidase n=1 Tax=Caballeronia mineralivorans PML1(12) TaxID=908627 RepID=A0A0J1CQX1_9BURK|nr:PepSY-associated TM helix domain-containing protein [Caballeronia mineralivorans]KLU23049.1 peptidase [Caballeronia mineralivorans PML1(12)]
MNAPEIFEPASNVTTMPRAPRGGRLNNDAEQIVRKQRSRRATFIKWLRKVHGWVGLWGAVLGLLFGTTGFLLNHRAGPLKISSGEPQVSQMQMALPAHRLNSPMELGKWLKQELELDGVIGRAKREPAHAVGWGDQKTMQPELWTVAVASPSGAVSAEYWVGNGFVSVKKSENGLLATMNNLHKGTGLSMGWVLLIDTLAGSIILLSLTGVLLWTELNKRKTVGAVIGVVSIVAMVGMGLM